MKSNLIITCEHAGKQIPDSYQLLFQTQKDVLNSHRGWDPGALGLAKFLASQLQVPLFYTDTSRLVVEANRSLDNEQLFSSFTNVLSKEQKAVILDQFYYPYRNGVENAIRQTAKPVLHLSIHSFTPVLNGEERTTDIGLLFDPSREKEFIFCSALQQKLKGILPDFKVDFNNPYRGTDDGFTTYLRSKFLNQDYMGIEIEINQKFIDKVQWPRIQQGIATALTNI